MRNQLNIFISYRRADSTGTSGRINDALKNDFNIFYDTEGIDYGNEFPKAITDAIEKSDVMLVIVGTKSMELFREKEVEKKVDYVLEEIVYAKTKGCKIIPLLIEGANMPEIVPKRVEFFTKLNADFIRHEKFVQDVQSLKKTIKKLNPKVIKNENRQFIQTVNEAIERERLVVLFSQDFTNIDHDYKSVKEEMELKFSNEFYCISIPSYVDEQEEYFSSIAYDCNMSCEVKKVSNWNRAIRKKIKNSSKPMLLFITDIENGNEALDKQFATILRNLKNEFSHFHALFIGRKSLANLVYGEGNLSPLNNAKELFFPDNNTQLGEEKIAQQFQTMGKNRNQVCKLLQKKSLGRYSAWSYNETINQLFWKNLLVKNGNRFAWRGELTKEIGRDILGCEVKV